MPPPSRIVRFSFLGFALVLGFFLRASALDTFGLSEDEVAKIQAVESYRRGQLSANAEHPMLMKLAMWASLSSAGAIGRGSDRMSEETALRLPNVIAGTATIAAVEGATTLLLSPWVGVTAALLVAVDPNVIAVNRIGKEDTFLLFFFFVAVWCYEKGKRVGVSDPMRARRRWYTASGAAFGLMLASKYMPHFLGLYALFNVVHGREAGINSPDKRRYYAAMLGAFLLANFAILLPSTWRYCLEYLSGSQLAHHGFFYGGALYATDTPLSAAGVPTTYYLRMIATKVPVAVLVAAAIGLVPLVRQPRERGHVWLRVMLVFLLLGYSIAAAKFQRYGMPILVMVDILAASGVIWAAAHVWTAQAGPALRRLAYATGIVAMVSASLGASVSARPFYSLHQNALGARLAPPATVYPEEAYDYGVREAVREIAGAASPHAAIVSDAPKVVAHYVTRSGRHDLTVLSLSQQGIAPPGERWVIVQNGHVYFENVNTITQLRQLRPRKEYRLFNTPVLELYHLSGEPSHRAVATAGSGAS
jgi:hypothetical protein